MAPNLEDKISTWDFYLSTLINSNFSTQFSCAEVEGSTETEGFLVKKSGKWCSGLSYRQRITKQKVFHCSYKQTMPLLLGNWE